MLLKAFDLLASALLTLASLSAAREQYNPLKSSGVLRLNSLEIEDGLRSSSLAMALIDTCSALRFSM